VCKKEHLEYENEALSEIAREADGALRDALSLLDQVMSFGKGVILLDDVSALIGGGSLVALQRWLSLWRAGGEESFLQLNDMFQRGASAQRVIEELFYITRNLWIAREFSAECIKNAGISKEEYDYVVVECELWNSKSLESLMMFLTRLLPQVRMGMRTDVIVGVLMSRRTEIINAEDNINDTDPKKIVKIEQKPEQKPEISVERKTGRNSIAQNNLSKNEDMDIKAIVSDSVSKIQDAHKSNLDDITYTAGAASFSTEEGFSPLDDEIRDKILMNLKSNEFVLFCALLDSEFLYNPDQNKFCIIIKHNYLFYFLSSGRYSAIFSGIIRAEYPQCKLLIVCGEKLNEFGEVYTAKVNSKEEKNKSEPESPVDAPSDKTIVEKTSSVLYDAARNALKFMRGEIVMHRIASDKPEEMDIS
jgi:hypothetical protein